MIAITEFVVTHLTGGSSWTSRPEPSDDDATVRPAVGGVDVALVYDVLDANRSYLLAGLRAGLIALVLLAVLAVIVWF